MIFDNGNGEILYYHEIQGFYMPKLKEIISEKMQNKNPRLMKQFH